MVEAKKKNVRKKEHKHKNKRTDVNTREREDKQDTGETNQGRRSQCEEKNKHRSMK